MQESTSNAGTGGSAPRDPRFGAGPWQCIPGCARQDHDGTTADDPFGECGASELIGAVPTDIDGWTLSVESTRGALYGEPREPGLNIAFDPPDGRVDSAGYPVAPQMLDLTLAQAQQFRTVFGAAVDDAQTGARTCMFRNCEGHAFGEPVGSLEGCAEYHETAVDLPTEPTDAGDHWTLSVVALRMASGGVYEGGAVLLFRASGPSSSDSHEQTELTPATARQLADALVRAADVAERVA